MDSANARSINNYTLHAYTCTKNTKRAIAIVGKLVKGHLRAQIGSHKTRGHDSHNKTFISYVQIMLST